MRDRPVSVIELVGFRRRADELLTQEEQTALVDLVAYEPTCGDVVPGTGWPQKNFGWPGREWASAAVRESFISSTTPEMPILLLAIYAKNEKADLNPAERKEFAELVKVFVSQWRRRR